MDNWLVNNYLWPENKSGKVTHLNFPPKLNSGKSDSLMLSSFREMNKCDGSLCSPNSGKRHSEFGGQEKSY